MVAEHIQRLNTWSCIEISLVSVSPTLKALNEFGKSRFRVDEVVVPISLRMNISHSGHRLLSCRTHPNWTCETRRKPLDGCYGSGVQLTIVVDSEPRSEVLTCRQVEAGSSNTDGH